MQNINIRIQQHSTSKAIELLLWGIWGERVSQFRRSRTGHKTHFMTQIRLECFDEESQCEYVHSLPCETMGNHFGVVKRDNMLEQSYYSISQGYVFVILWWLAWECHEIIIIAIINLIGEGVFYQSNRNQFNLIWHTHIRNTLTQMYDICKYLSMLGINKIFTPLLLIAVWQKYQRII